MRSACLALLCIATTLAQSSEVDRLRIQPASYLAHVKALSSDDFAGRGNGSLGLERASQYIESEFKKAGLMPGGDSDKFLQSFDISKQLELDDTNAVTVTGGGAEAFVFRIGAHYYPLSKRIGNDAKHSSTRTTDTVVFAGYGIAAPELGYDDYAAVDVHDKAVLVWTHEPQEHDRRSSFDGQNLTPHSDIARKVEMAARRGASLLLVVEDPSHTVDRARMRSWASDPQADEYPIPVVRVDSTQVAACARRHRPRSHGSRHRSDAATTVSCLAWRNDHIFDDIDEPRTDCSQCRWDPARVRSVPRERSCRGGRALRPSGTGRT